MAKWECLTGEEAGIVRSLGYEPGPMVVNRVGDGRWMFKDLKTQDELIVSEDSGKLRGTYIASGITPPARTGGVLSA